ncbi:iron permease [Fragilariopsis cylindrus CCMP1102]|uniref:Iron permease n=1 Tax=Fragilariopsis cylindrus CCMP1102 TaxID=635003 RepID=A0A1E7F4G6_9STRA|nr:iron permease [Fragilariopsis cylindrus CCMP1102]|eukprot:OEU13037.1 iron permease [Fragilariopsis cylindrus CCMP1102]
MSAPSLLDFAVITIFTRETLEGGIIIGEYRTVILRTNWDNSPITQNQALRAVTVSSLLAALVAVVICAAVAVPLAIMSRDFDPRTAKIIEGVSKIVAAICLLQLSLKMPKFFGLYYSKAQVKKIKNGETIDESIDSHGMTLKSIRFNIAWNIWREVAECGVFLIPFFLTGEGIVAIPLSAVIGLLVGGFIVVLIYYANRHFKSTKALTIFTVGLFILLSTGLFTGGCNNFEKVLGKTPTIYTIEGDFWSIDRLPMTIFKPFGYSDTRTVLQMCCFWVWIAFCLLLHYIKYKKCVKPSSALSEVTTDEREEITNEELGIEYVPDALKSSCISTLCETQELTTELADSDNGPDAEAGEGIKAKETSISMVAEA